MLRFSKEFDSALNLKFKSDKANQINLPKFSCKCAKSKCL